MQNINGTNVGQKEDENDKIVSIRMSNKTAKKFKELKENGEYNKKTQKEFMEDVLDKYEKYCNEKRNTNQGVENNGNVISDKTATIQMTDINCFVNKDMVLNNSYLVYKEEEDNIISFWGEIIYGTQFPYPKMRLSALEPQAIELFKRDYGISSDYEFIPNDYAIENWFYVYEPKEYIYVPETIKIKRKRYLFIEIMKIYKYLSPEDRLDYGKDNANMAFYREFGNTMLNKINIYEVDSVLEFMESDYIKPYMNINDIINIKECIKGYEYNLKKIVQKNMGCRNKKS